MPSEIGRGIKFGIGFALGVGFVTILLLFSFSMCAGRLHRHMMENLLKQRPPTPEPQNDPLALQSEGRSLVLAAGGQAMAFEVRSTAFPAGETIPPKYTCDGPDVSPPLNWTEPPAGTKSLALIMDDPDAPVGTWVHWVLYNLPASTRELSESTATTETLAGGTKQGSNDFRKIGYGGPCPPQGPAHRYFFKLYALDTELNLAPKATKKQVETAMEGHILTQAELMARYGRQ